MWSAESAFAEFKKRVPQWHSLDVKSNEAETRLKLINEILFAVLGWTTATVDVEKYCREVGFADYVFKQNSVLALVLEAKKIGDTFTVPLGRFSNVPVPFALLGKESPAAKSALLQAIGYAVTLGSRYVAISNGLQWLFTLTYVDNQAVDERLVFAFDSIGIIDENFRTFFNCFSPNGICDNAVHELFFESRKMAPPPKLSRSIPGYPVPSRRNVYVNELSYILRLLWETIAREEKSEQFIANCYVETRADDNLIGYAKGLLARRQNADYKYFESTVDDTKSVTQAIWESGDRPFIILGDVGHGKSTFLSYLRFNAATALLKGYFQIDLNFLDRPDTATEVAGYIYRAVETQILTHLEIDIFADEIVRGVLYTDFKRFKGSARYKVLEGDASAQKKEEQKFIEERIADRHSYFSDLFRYLKKGQKRSVVIFFDNLDRRNVEIQEEAFLKASAIARDWECAVFVCLRPTTFFESIKQGVLDALAPKTFTVGAPDLSLVLKRRFDFARRIAIGDACKEAFEASLQEPGISVNLPSVADIFACCEFQLGKKLALYQCFRRYRMAIFVY